jgi:hypothetical protein
MENNVTQYNGQGLLSLADAAVGTEYTSQSAHLQFDPRTVIPYSQMPGFEPRALVYDMPTGQMNPPTLFPEKQINQKRRGRPVGAKNKPKEAPTENQPPSTIVATKKQKKQVLK